MHATFKKLFIALLIIAAIAIPALWYTNRAYSRSFGRDGFFPDSEYSSLLKASNPAIVAHFPKSIPTNATGVRVWAIGLRELFPAPDASMQLRVIIPIADAIEIEKSAVLIQKALFAKPNVNVSSSDSESRDLVTADDKDTSTLLPPGFSTYIMVNPSGDNQGGITINTATGEVIYWYFEI